MDYICDACGFTTEEKPGVYICPKCGNQMRAAKYGKYSGDTPNSVVKWFIYFLEIIVLFPILFTFLGGIPGLIIFIIIFLLVRNWINNRSQNNAYKKSPNIGTLNPNTIYTCNSCGGQFKGKRTNCPYCGIKLSYKN